MLPVGILVTVILLTLVLSQTARHRVWERPPVERIPLRDECNVVLAFVGGQTQIVPGSPHQRRRNRFQPRDQWDFAGEVLLIDTAQRQFGPDRASASSVAMSR